jgi:hypothetical protein
VVSGPGLPPCHLRVESDQAPQSFQLQGAGLDIALPEPFSGEPAPPEAPGFDPRFDPRFVFLLRHCQSLQEPESAYLPWYWQALELWAALEAQTKHVGPHLSS